LDPGTGEVQVQQQSINKRIAQARAWVFFVDERSLMLDGLAGKVAVVTGGSRGIGRSIALDLARNCVHVSFNYVNSKDAAENVVSEIRKLGAKAIAVKADVRNSEEAKFFVDQTRKEFERIDFLVNNAGILRDKTLMLMTDTDWKDVIDTNLNGPFNLTRLIITGLLKQRSGSIVNISSTAGMIGNAGQVNYSSSKAGVIGFTKSLAKEVAPYGVRVNAVAPGFIETDMVKNIPGGKMKEAIQTVPMKRIGTPEEVAKVVTFLLSDAASYITGQVLPIDGGLAI